MLTAFIIPTLRGGGAEMVVSRLSQYVCRKLPVLVITWDTRDRLYEVGGRLVDLELPASKSIFGKAIRQRQRMVALGRILKEAKVSHAIAFMEAAGVPLAMVKKRLMPDLMATVSMRCSPTALGLIARCQVKRWYPYVDRVVMQTAASAAHITAWGIPPQRCVVIPNPLPDVWLESVRPLVGREKNLIVAVGRLDLEKDFSLLLTAFSLLSLPAPPRLAILGEGPLKASLMAQAEALGISKRVEFVGRVMDVRSLMDRARVFALTSRSEGFPNALAEAMARGCAVVSTDCPMGPREMIVHGQSGWLVPVGDPLALSQALTEALLDDQRAAKCALAARTRAEEWAIDRIAALWLEPDLQTKGGGA